MTSEALSTYHANILWSVLNCTTNKKPKSLKRGLLWFHIGFGVFFVFFVLKLKKRRFFRALVQPSFRRAVSGPATPPCRHRRHLERLNPVGLPVYNDGLTAVTMFQNIHRRPLRTPSADETRLSSQIETGEYRNGSGPAALKVKRPIGLSAFRNVRNGWPGMPSNRCPRQL